MKLSIFILSLFVGMGAAIYCLSCLPVTILLAIIILCIA